MRQIPLLILIVSLLGLEVQAKKSSDIYKSWTKGGVIGAGCISALSSQATFCSTSSSSSKSHSHKRGHSDSDSCYCTDIDYEGSVIYCGYQLSSTDKEKEEFNSYLTGLCSNLDSDDFDSVYENVTDYLVDTSTVSNFSSSTVIDYPIYYDSDLAEAYIRTEVFYYKSYNDGIYFGGILIAYFIGIFFLAGISFWCKELFPGKIMAINRTIQKNRLVRTFKKYVVLPAFLNGTHTTPIRVIAGYWPTRIESIVIGIFYFLSLLFHCINYGYHSSSSSRYSTKVEYLSSLIADRSGLISTFLIILTFFMGGRNNLFLWWTGWKQATFFAIHKAVARVMVASASVHSIAYTIKYVDSGKYSRSHSEDYWVWGSVAVVAGAVMLIQGMGKLRALSYEIFLYLHLALAILFLYGAWIHLVRMGFQKMLYPMAAVWAFDRFVRLVRIAHFGVRTANAKAVTDEIIKIEIPKHKFYKLYPGAFGYVYFMRPTIFWQSHPFSVIESGDGKNLLLYVKAKRGATDSIMKYLTKQDGKSANIRVLFEGPYGSYHSMTHYEVPIFYGSTVGITGIYPYLRDCLTSNSGSLKSAKFYWIVQYADALGWFMDELKFLQQFETLETVIYLTREKEQQFEFYDTSSANDTDGKEKESTTKESTNTIESVLERFRTELPNVELRFGRPDIDVLVRDDASNFSSNDIGIMTCGHGVICDQVRKTVADLSVSRSTGVLDYLEELQIW